MRKTSYICVYVYVLTTLGGVYSVYVENRHRHTHSNPGKGFFAFGKGIISLRNICIQQFSSCYEQIVDQSGLLNTLGSNQLNSA